MGVAARRHRIRGRGVDLGAVLAWRFPSDVIGGLLVASGLLLQRGCGSVRPPALGSAARERIRRARLALRTTRRGCPRELLGLACSPCSGAQDLVSFARLHTAATATALAIMATSAGLLATAALIADDRQSRVAGLAVCGGSVLRGLEVSLPGRPSSPASRR